MHFEIRINSKYGKCIRYEYSLSPSIPPLLSRWREKSEEEEEKKGNTK